MIDEKKVKAYQKELEQVEKEVAKIVVGQQDPVKAILKTILANGHVLVEGVPGVAKTLVVRALGQATGCITKRIQFTVDLLPTDITGITTFNEKQGFTTVKGPIFANFVIGDEINRAPPKTQSALLEAMQEKQVTIGKESFQLDPPFFVMATMNPLESSGTYQLPEAQIDRFLLKVHIGYPKFEDEQIVLNRNITLRKFEDYGIKPVIGPKRIIEMQDATREIYVSPKVEKYILHLVNATRNPKKYGIKMGRYIEYGGSPRASINLFIASKADALISGKNFVSPQNVKNIAHDVMRHRIILNYEGQADNIKTDDIIKELLAKIKVP